MKIGEAKGMTPQVAPSIFIAFCPPRNMERNSAGRGSPTTAATTSRLSQTSKCRRDSPKEKHGVSGTQVKFAVQFMGAFVND